MPATDTAQVTATRTKPVVLPGQAKWKYATKTALSLTLAYLIPMAMGWPQPSTAAITVMLVAATGMASESLQKGVMRVLGTVAGAIIGLTLVALFPQERMTYLFAASITVSLLAYLYNAYQGDSTLFMLTAVVTLMVFNGGDAEGAFIYGVDRAFMTAFGVIVYTVVASTLWPVRAVDNTRILAAAVGKGYHRAFKLLVHPATEGPENNKQQLAELLVAEEAFQTHFAAVKRYADGVTAYLAEWYCIVRCYEELQSVLLPALSQETRRGVDFSRYLENYDGALEEIENRFRQVDARWRGQSDTAAIPSVVVQYREDSLRGEPHLTIAAVASRAELLKDLRRILLELEAALDSALFDRGNFVAGGKTRGKPGFIWLDLENVKTSVRMFVTFWLATAVWITVNPPIGFTFVALCSVLVLLVSYTPVTPKLLFILFSLGFIFALPAYVFLLPLLTHWLELAVFMFCYAFLGFYLFQGPISIFFLLGLFALGIQNTMSYHFDLILLAVITFYLMCALLIITTHFPFSSKPERLYPAMCRRFFHSSARLLERAGDYRARARPLPGNDGSGLLLKLRVWGAKIDGKAFVVDPSKTIAQLNQACDLPHGQVQVLLSRRDEFAHNRLIVASRKPGSQNLLVALCDALARRRAENKEGDENAADDPFTTIETRLINVRVQLDELRREIQLEKYNRAELAQFFVYLNLRSSILDSIQACHRAHRAVDWDQLARSRF